MGTYNLKWTEEVWYSANVEADSEGDAYNKLFEGKIDYDAADAYGGEIQDGVDIQEVV